MQFLSDFSIKKPVTTIMLIASMVGIGLISLLGLPVELFPSLDFPVATVRVSYEGVAPEDMEDLVTDPIENAIQGVEGIEGVTSYSNEGTSFVVIEFEWGTDLDDKIVDIKDKMTKVRGKLPTNIDEPVVSSFDMMNSESVMKLNLSGAKLDILRRYGEDTITPKLERIAGVASIEVYGGLTREILVKVDPYKLESVGLNVNSIITLLREASVNTPAGNIKEGDKEFLLRVMGKVEKVEDIENLIVYNKGGKILRLKEVVEIYLGYDERDSYNRFNGSESVSLNIIKTSSGNTVSISKAIKAMLTEIKEDLPEGVKLEIGNDQADYVNDSMQMVKDSAVAALILATIILFIFLKNIRATIIVSLAIPTSIVFTFVLIKGKGLSMNLLSLGGLALGVGMLVDNAVIVLENIYRHLTEYKKPILEAARDGSAEMGLPILASTATTIAVFLPIVFTKGLAGQIFTDFSYTIAFALGASMLVALTFVPMLSSKLLKGNIKLSKEGFLFKITKKVYRKFLSVVLKHRVVTMIITFIVFFGTIIGIGKQLGMEFFPKTDDGEYSVTAELPAGLDVEKSNRISLKLEEIVRANKFTEKYITTVEKDKININVRTPNKDSRDIGIRDIVAGIRKKVGNIPDAEVRVGASQRGGGGGAAIEVKIFGDDYDRLVDYSQIIRKKMESVDGVVDIKSSFEGGSPELRIKVDREKAEYYGLSVAYVSSILNSKLLGIVPLELQVAGEEIDVKVELKDEFKSSIKKIEDVVISLPSGGMVRLGEIAHTELGEGPSSIQREDKAKVLTLSADSAGRDLGSITTDLKKALKDVELPKGYKYGFGGNQEDMQEMMKDLSMAFAVAIFLVYMILASQFESFVLPFIIMGSVPLALIGVVWGLFITGFSISMTVMIGIIMLAGIVVNNAIVLIDYINLLKAREVERHEAIQIAGETRLRPILMTTMTTVFGMVPLGLGIGASADFYQPLAISVIFGLSVSTILTLIVIPVSYSLVDDIRIGTAKGFAKLIEKFKKKDKKTI